MTILTQTKKLLKLPKLSTLETPSLGHQPLREVPSLGGCRKASDECADTAKETPTVHRRCRKLGLLSRDPYQIPDEIRSFGSKE